MSRPAGSDRDRPERISETTWRMWAEIEEDGEFSYTGDRRTVLAEGGLKPALVMVIQNEEGPYWGWLAKGEEWPSIISLRKQQFNICFAYGPEADEKKRNGKIVRLGIERMLDQKSLEV